MSRISSSRTAEFAALLRAAHLKRDREPFLFRDLVAIDLLEPEARLALKIPGVFWVLERMGPIRPARAQVLVRARWAEDRLERAVENGVAQYAILGAGLDSYALRRLGRKPEVRIFELDHPNNQRVKLEKLQRMDAQVPSCVEFVPIDLENESVSVALQTSGLARRRQSFFSWLGVLHYLTDTAIQQTLSQLRLVAAPGSELVLDYGLADDVLSQSDRAVKKRVEEEARARGEEMLSFLTPMRMHSLAEAAGWEIVEDLSPEEQRARYLRGRADQLDILGMFSLLALRVASPALKAVTSTAS